MFWTSKSLLVYITNFLFKCFFYAGIGYEIVLDLASRGCKVIIADINVEGSVKDVICRRTKNSNIVMQHLDLSSFQSVRKFAEFLKNSEKNLDILINNAGIPQGTFPRTEDGLQRILQVNYYSSFLLTHLLVGKIANSNIYELTNTIFCRFIEAIVSRSTNNFHFIFIVLLPWSDSSQR